MLDRRTFLHGAGVLSLYASMPPIAEALPKVEVQTHNYEVHGTYRLFRLDRPFTGKLRLAERMNLVEGWYEILIKGRVSIDLYVLDYTTDVLVQSKGIIEGKVFKPTESRIELKGIIPKQLGHEDIHIAYNYQSGQVIFTKDETASPPVSMEQGRHLDDLGSAYLNYKHGNVRVTGNQFGIWIVNKLKEEPDYQRISVSQNTNSRGKVLVTRDLHKLLKAVDRYTPSRVTVSIDGVVEEGSLKVRSREMKLRRVG